MPTVLIPMQKGHIARLLLYSGVITRLAQQGVRVVLLNSLGRDFPLPDEARATGQVTLDKLPLPRLRWEYGWARIYRYLFPTVLPTSAARAREAAMRDGAPVQYALIRSLKRLRLLQPLLHGWIWVRRVMIPAGLYRPVFEKHRPDLVVTGTLAKGLDDYYLLRYARQTGVRSVCAVQSWDTLSGKEYRLESPDRLAVWNEINRTEAVNLHHFRPDQIRVTGVPQFDIYFRPAALFADRATWLQKLGLDPARQLIFVTPQPGHVRMTVDYAMEQLAQALANEQFVLPSQVLIRPHPAVYSGAVKGQGTEADLRRYEALHPLIKANRPLITNVGLSADTAQSEHEWLANTLRHSAVVVDWFGTMAVEACAVGTPVVYVEFQDGERPMSGQAAKPPVRYVDFEHLQAVFDLKAIPIAATATEMLTAINRYLLNPDLESDPRRRVAERIAYRTDGRAAARLAEVIRCYALGQWPEQAQLDKVQP